jgi:DNA-binding beta-propeller fold protein YncE
VDEGDRRIVLDPQNGYALLLQSPEGEYLDTLGSFDLHLEYSQYMVRDPAGRLIISHPGDEYSPRHSVRVTDQDANLLFEFGDRGSGPGQFETPTGVAIWGDPCAFGGPYTVDEHTLLLLHFDGDYAGAQGEAGTANSTGFEAGRHGQGVLVDDTDTLTYTTAGNLNRTAGSIEFWLRPNWPGDDMQSYTFFEVGNEWFNRMRVMKDGANNLRFMVWDSTTEYGVAHNVDDWQAGEWHHIAATWQGTDIGLHVDGTQVASESNAHPPDTLSAEMYVGSASREGQQANAVIDELRISDIPRVGNSEACNHILVADSGNHRLQAFDSLGNFLAEFGSFGSGDGQFSTPQGLAVDESGRVLVADRGNNRLVVLSFDGTEFGYLDSFSAGFNAPTDVALDSQGNIAVADTGNNRVVVLDAEGEFTAEYTEPNDGYSGTFNAPRGVAVNPWGNLVVADTGNRRVVTVRGALAGFKTWLPLVVRRWGTE